jgi:urease subunit gamma/beta
MGDMMLLSEAERDRLLVFMTAELARARWRRGLRLNVVEATALVADAVCEAARDGGRLADAIEAGRSAPSTAGRSTSASSPAGPPPTPGR